MKKEYLTSKIRNVAFFGHQGSGKTTTLEAILEMQNVIKTAGSIEKKNTVSDFLEEEQKRGASFSTALASFEYNDLKINILDTPGSGEMQNDQESALRAIELAVIFVDATKGVEVGTIRIWKTLGQLGIPRMIFVNKMDKENAKLDNVLKNINERLGASLTPFMLPIGEEQNLKGFIKSLTLEAFTYNKPYKMEPTKAPSDLLSKATKLKEELLEHVAESSEELLEKYFSGTKLTNEEIDKGLYLGINNLDLTPVLFGSATKKIGIDMLLAAISKYGKKLDEKIETEAFSDKELKNKVKVKMSDKEPFSGFVFKTIIDPYVGSLNFVKILSGTLSSGNEFLVANSNQTKRVSVISTMLGKEQLEVGKAYAGDIIVLPKLDLNTGDTICDLKNKVFFPPMKYVRPILYLAIVPKSRQDEDKLSDALRRLNIEDPSFERVFYAETGQLLIGGLGMTHLQFIMDKMKSTYKVDVKTEPQKITYRETIKKRVQAHGRHRKQSGGAGQFGEVYIRFEPSKEEFEFHEEIFGGAVPKNYHPAVEKGLIETFEKGPLAGFPVIFIKATLYDGSYHSVDSNEISFKMAANLAFKDAVSNQGANPTLLEPIMRVKIIVDDKYVGDIMGDISKRRGRLQGTEQGQFQGEQIIIAEIPEAEIVSYAIDLKAMTQGAGTFTRKFLRYEEVPANLIPKIIEEHKKE